jgi:hypothetical protein
MLPLIWLTPPDEMAREWVRAGNAVTVAVPPLSIYDSSSIVGTPSVQCAGVNQEPGDAAVRCQRFVAAETGGTTHGSMKQAKTRFISAAAKRWRRTDDGRDEARKQTKPKIMRTASQVKKPRCQRIQT